MAHIHTKPGQHDQTISIYIFRTDLKTPKVILHYHHKMKAYAQFGGHVELHENPWEATLHELEEESGYTMEQLRILQPSQPLPAIRGSAVHPYPVLLNTMSYPGESAHRHTDVVYAFTTDQEPAGKPADGESEDLKSFSRNEVEKRTNDTIDTITGDIALYIFDSILDTWKPTKTDQFKL